MIANQTDSSDDELTRKHRNSGIFLQRNKRKLKQIRKAMLTEKDGEELHQVNGLVMRRVPQVGKIVFEAGTTDVL